VPMVNPTTNSPISSPITLPVENTTNRSTAVAVPNTGKPLTEDMDKPYYIFPKIAKVFSKSSKSTNSKAGKCEGSKSSKVDGIAQS